MIHPSEMKQICRESRRGDYFKIIVLLNIDCVCVCVCVCVCESTHTVNTTVYVIISEKEDKLSNLCMPGSVWSASSHNSAKP